MSDKLETKGITCAHFINSVSLLDEKFSVAVGQTCISIQPATLLPDGTPSAIDKGQTPTGLLVRRQIVAGPDRGKVRRIWVPMSNVRFCEASE